tara:strand:- start:762 stop:1046 length:285 start_codon:yes stop_codon:yes gene_type:complete
MKKIKTEIEKFEHEEDWSSDEMAFFPKGKKGVKLVWQLSRNIASEHMQKYVTIGVIASCFPQNTGEQIEAIIEEFEAEKSARPSLVIKEVKNGK